ncbi:MAG: 30S ribosomal protein S27e [Candidatus Thermoplasmatota archaeon]
MPSSFYKVRCKDCGNLQIIFSKASIQVQCQVCGSILASPTGGKAKIKGEIVAELKNGKGFT